MIRIILVVVASVYSLQFAFAEPLKRADPISVGFSPTRLQRIDDAIDREVRENRIPGAVVLIARNGAIAYQKSFGFADVAAEKLMQNDAIFRIASMTKVITTVGVMILYERGNFLLSDPVAKFLPDFANPKVVSEIGENGEILQTRSATSEIRIIDLLTHTSGIGYPFIPSSVSRTYVDAGIIDGLTSQAVTLESNIKRLADQPLLFDPATGFAYGLSTDVLGRLIEVVSGNSLGQFFEDEILTPLGMVDTHFYLPDSKRDRLVVLYADADGNGITPAHGDDVDLLSDSPNYPIEGARAYFSGGAGLSSTAADYAMFLQMLLSNGELSGKRILSRKSVELMRVSRVDRDGDGDTDMGFGFNVVDSVDQHSELASPGRYSWGGAFYTYYWVDPQECMIGIFLSQLRPTRSNIRDIVGVLMYQALE